MMSNRDRGVLFSFLRIFHFNLRCSFDLLAMIVLVGAVLLVPDFVRAADDPTLLNPEASNTPQQPSKRVQRKRPGACRAQISNQSSTESKAPALQKGGTLPQIIFSLIDFLNFNPEDPLANPAVRYPFTVMNAGEKAYALILSTPPRKGIDPLYGREAITIYPTLAGEVPEAGGRMVVGQENAVGALVRHLGAISRGERVGRRVGWPGPPGTGKTEAYIALHNLAVNLAREHEKYREYSYRFARLYTIPSLRGLFRYDRDGNPLEEFYDPDLPRSPFTLLRRDRQDAILRHVKPLIHSRYKMAVSKGWTDPEPKSRSILQKIFEFVFPQYSNGSKTINQLSNEEYDEFLTRLNEYVVVVPRERLAPDHEPRIFRNQTDDPNMSALFAAPNLRMQALVEYNSPFAVDYKGQLFLMDGRLAMIDEMYRNPPSLLNILLELFQNQILQTDYGTSVYVDMVPVWNSNDESIAEASENAALKASLDRAEKRPMRLLLHPNQIEQVSLFQLGLDMFSMRALDSNEKTPIEVGRIYPGGDSEGRTYSAYRRFALYYEGVEGDPILISPLALNYMSWIASATRMVTDRAKLMDFRNELNLVTGNPSQFLDPIYRLRVILREIIPSTDAELVELSKMTNLLEEGQNGVSARDMETWFKEVVNTAVEGNKTTITPAMVDQAFQTLLDNGGIKPAIHEQRAHWQNLRQEIKLDMLLPKLENDVRTIISGEGQKAERIYDEVVRELTELAANPDALYVGSDGGAQNIPINKERLNAIKLMYRKKFSKTFQDSFLLRMLNGSSKGPRRDPQLLDAIQHFLADQDALTADYISAFDAHYKGQNRDPRVAESVSRTEHQLLRYGYDPTSFREAVAFVNSMRNEKMIRDRSN